MKFNIGISLSNFFLLLSLCLCINSWSWSWFWRVSWLRESTLSDVLRLSCFFPLVGSNDSSWILVKVSFLGSLESLLQFILFSLFWGHLGKLGLLWGKFLLPASGAIRCGRVSGGGCWSGSWGGWVRGASLGSAVSTIRGVGRVRTIRFVAALLFNFDIGDFILLRWTCLFFSTLFEDTAPNPHKDIVDQEPLDLGAWFNFNRWFLIHLGKRCTLAIDLDWCN